VKSGALGTTSNQLEVPCQCQLIGGRAGDRATFAMIRRAENRKWGLSSARPALFLVRVWA
jgi:hypothetical protein